MSTEIATIPDHESWLRVYEPMIELAGRLATSPFVPDKMRGNPADTFSVLLAGHGLGLSPIQSLQSIVLISGKPYISTEVILGLAYRAGHQVTWLESTDKKATVRVVRGDGHGSAEITYTLAQAQAAGLTGKDNWKRMPAEMLRARAVRAALKMVAPDIALGLETAESPAAALIEAPAGGTTVVQIKPAVVDDISEPPVGSDSPAPQSDSHRAADAITMHSPQHDADVVVSKTKPLPAIEPPVTTAQLRKLNAQLSEVETLDGAKMSRDDRRDMIGALAGVHGTLASAKDLTQAQASRAIEALQGLLDAAVPPAVDEEPLP